MLIRRTALAASRVLIDVTLTQVPRPGRESTPARRPRGSAARIDLHAPRRHAARRTRFRPGMVRFAPGRATRARRAASPAARAARPVADRDARPWCSRHRV